MSYTYVYRHVYEQCESNTSQLPSTSRCAPWSPSSSSRLLFQNLYNLRLFESLVSRSLATEKTCFRSARWRADLSVSAAAVVVGELDIHALSATNDISVPKSRRLFLLGGSGEPAGARDCTRGSSTVDITRSNAWFDVARARRVRKGAISVSMGARGGRSSLASESQASALSSSSR